MTFPLAPLDLRTELKLGGTWTGITSYVSERVAVTIRRGRADEASNTEPSAATMTLDNRTGRFSPRNPTGAYYGTIGRNTPIRCSLPGDGTVALRIPGTPGADYVSCPDTAGVSVVGDIDIRIDATLDNWQQYQGLAVKGGYAAGSQLSWNLYLGAGGQPAFVWTTGGTSATEKGAGATANVSQAPGTRLALRATVAVATGTLTFHTAATIAGPWTQLGAPVVLGATSIFDSTAAVQVGEHGNARTANASITAGKIHSFQLLAGIGGAVRASPDFTALAAGTTSFADAQANAWTLAGDAEITGRRYRLHAEVSNWGPRSDLSGNDLTAPIQAAGILRRLGQGSSPLHSPIYRSIVRAPANLRAYWACEETGSDTTTFASGLGGAPMRISGSPTLASNSAIGGSSALPLVSNSKWTGTVPAYTPTSATQVRLLACIPAAGMTNGAVLCRILTTGTCASWDVVYTTAAGGGLDLRGYGPDGVNLFTSGASIGMNGSNWRVSVDLTQSGANIDWALWTAPVGTSSASGPLGTQAGRTVGRVTTIVVDPTGNVDAVAVGHIGLWTVINSIFDTDLQLTGYVGETAGRRFQRLCLEEGIALRSRGSLSATAVMGAQRADKLLDLLRECADTDQAIIYEPRDVLALGFRTRTSLYNQVAAVTLSASAGQLSEAPEPVDDDQATRNDITVNRRNGSWAIATLDTGTLSTLPPPNGVGRYDTQVTVNPRTDDQLIDMAGWLLLHGTVYEERFPSISVNLAASQISGSPTLTADVARADIGDLLVVTGATPTWLPVDPINQIIQGSVETLGLFEWRIAWNCSPGSPWRVGVADDPVLGRCDTDGSQLAAGVTSTAATLSVATTSGPLWTTAAGDFPLGVTVAGERMTVTNITGAASPQTFTVVRSVNGVVKAQLAAADVRLTQPMILGL